MKLSIKGLALASGIVWAVAVLFVAVCNQVWPAYGVEFLLLIGSVYPGYQPDSTVTSILLVTGLAFLDGLLGGVIFAFLYNLFAKK